jgi:hypothetical protein
MAADRTVRRIAGRAAWRCAAVAALSVAALAAALPAGAAAPDRPALDTVTKPVRAKSKAAPTHVWHDGAGKRALSIDTTLEADFSPAGGDDRVLRRAGATPKSASSLVSPVLRDEAGRLRALPGGVIVVLAAPADEAAGRALLVRNGASPVRRLSDTLWLVEGPVGLGSLELANRLQATGRFASAQPNWWVERTLK